MNLGDTYSGTGSKKNAKDPKYTNGRNGQSVAMNNKTSVPNKSLCCIPDRFKIEMIDRGWICRNEIVWFKPNCMPSSVKDRFTVDYEKVFFFVKSKKYFFKMQYEPLSPFSTPQKKSKVKTTTNYAHISPTYKRAGGGSFINPNGKGRNKRCVWQVNTKPFKEAHFATYPEALIQPMVKAGCPKGGVVLDIFMGSGTTAYVARSLERNYLGIELNSEYIKIANKRLAQQVLL